MGELFANFKGYDVQVTRKEAKEEGRQEACEKDLVELIGTVQELGHSKMDAKHQLMKRYGFSDQEAEDKVELCWQAGQLSS